MCVATKSLEAARIIDVQLVPRLLHKAVEKVGQELQRYYLDATDVSLETAPAVLQHNNKNW